jgi:hypothetical protein
MAATQDESRVSQGKELRRLHVPLLCWHESLASARTDPLIALGPSLGYIATERPLPVGTAVFLELSLGHASHAARAPIDGVVVGAEGPADLKGFSVRFVAVDDAVETWIGRHLAALETAPKAAPAGLFDEPSVPPAPVFFADLPPPAPARGLPEVLEELELELGFEDAEEVGFAEAAEVEEVQELEEWEELAELAAVPSTLSLDPFAAEEAPLSPSLDPFAPEEPLPLDLPAGLFAAADAVRPSLPPDVSFSSAPPKAPPSSSSDPFALALPEPGWDAQDLFEEEPPAPPEALDAAAEGEPEPSSLSQIEPPELPLPAALEPFSQPSEKPEPGNAVGGESFDPFDPFLDTETAAPVAAAAAPLSFDEFSASAGADFDDEESSAAVYEEAAMPPRPKPRGDPPGLAEAGIGFSNPFARATTREYRLEEGGFVDEPEGSEAEEGPTASAPAAAAPAPSDAWPPPPSLAWPPPAAAAPAPSAAASGGAAPQDTPAWGLDRRDVVAAAAPPVSQSEPPSSAAADGDIAAVRASQFDLGPSGRGKPLPAAPPPLSRPAAPPPLPFAPTPNRETLRFGAAPGPPPAASPQAAPPPALPPTRTRTQEFPQPGPASAPLLSVPRANPFASPAAAPPLSFGIGSFDVDDEVASSSPLAEPAFPGPFAPAVRGEGAVPPAAAPVEAAAEPWRVSPAAAPFGAEPDDLPVIIGVSALELPEEGRDDLGEDSWVVGEPGKGH